MRMSAACADRMRRGHCGDCARVDPCKALFAQLFGRSAPDQRPRDETDERPFENARSPLMTMLGLVARAIEANARPQNEKVRVNDREVDAPEGSFRREIEQRIEPMLERGPVRIEAVARALGCSRQTLYRRLKEEGVTFAELLDALRRRLGLHYVRERGMSVKEAAYRLGFSEPAAFSRAYKRWTGSSPRRLDS
jgi:AraC-like DNA-binding protein